MQPNQELLDEFWQFVAERHRIWYKRNILKQKRPWTDDKILNTYHFCNIFRILDTGTQFYVNSIMPTKMTKKELLWCTIIYRVFNRIDTFQELGYKNVLDFDKEKVANILKEKERRDNFHIFSRAFMTTGVKFAGADNKIDNYVWCLEQIYNDLDNIFRVVNGSNSMKLCWEKLKKYDGIGGFLAQQICVDLSYTDIVNYDNNEWTYCGNGARKGLEILYGKNIDHLTVLKCFYGVQNGRLPKYFSIPIPIWVKHYRGGISLNDLENCCCEFSKYYTLKYDTKKKGRKRVYVPHHIGEVVE